MGTPVDDLLPLTQPVLQQLTSELMRRCDECLLADPQSQLSACFLLAMRALSLINGWGVMLRTDTSDSYEELGRAHLEAGDPLMTFRFYDEVARNKIRYWLD